MVIVFCMGCNAPAQIDKGSFQTVSETGAIDSSTIYFSSILKKNIPDSSDIGFLKNYSELKGSIHADRIKFYQTYLLATTDKQKASILDSCQVYLHEALANNVFPFWYGTAWDFNGISNEPQHGQIACGYFVSTTLKHCGFNLNRYKIAQQYSHSIVKTLCTDVVSFTDIDELIRHLSSKPDQLYIVGLDNHVGFISNQHGVITFVHSTFVDDACVIFEKAHESLVLKNSRRYVLGNLLDNDTLLLHWLSASPIVVRY